MTMEPTATRARTQGDMGEPFRPQRNAIFERARRMQTPAARGRARACAQIASCTPLEYSRRIAGAEPPNPGLTLTQLWPCRSSDGCRLC